MGPLVVFLGLFVPTFFLSYLSAGGDEILGQVRPSMRLGAVVALTAVALVGLRWVGVGWSWALALTMAGLVGARLGDWLGRGGWAAARRRARRRHGPALSPVPAACQRVELEAGVGRRGP